MSATVAASPDTPCNSPGAVLKRCREYHEISLEEASQTTKIGISYLKALEEDQISGFANRTYLKGFLRIYATYLGLNPDDMARMYDKLYGVKECNINDESSSVKNDRPVRRLASLRKLLLPAALLLIILVFATLFKRQPAPAIRPSQPLAPTAALIPASAIQALRTSAKIRTLTPEIIESKVEIRADLANGSDKPSHPKKPSDAAKGFILRIKVTQNGNLNVAIDGSGAQSYELTVGDIIEWKAEKNVALDLSNAGGVDVELNGKLLKQLGPIGKPAYIILDAGGIKQ